MSRLYDGVSLRSAASSALEQLPEGPVALVATSEAGAGLAAACAALRDQPTTWRKINLLTDAGEMIHPVVVVDPVDAGDGWRAAIRRRFPKALFVKTASPDAELDLAA